MKKKLFAMMALALPLACLGQKLSEDLTVTRISEGVYVHTSYEDMGKWGRVASNGLIVVEGGKALMVDTPMDPGQTKDLAAFVKDSLKAELVMFVPGHFHDDCVGGMEYLKSIGVETYAHKMTNDLLAREGKPAAGHSFTGSKVLKLGGKRIECYYLGGGHSKDNIVVWIPGEKVLFGGCMVKDAAATDIGNLSDAAPFGQWLETIVRVENRFPQAGYVVPGHGAYGGRELLAHTKEMLRAEMGL